MRNQKQLRRTTTQALTAVFLTFFFNLSFAQEEAASGQLLGKVIAQGSESALAGALITAVGVDVERFAKTDAEGNFSIELPQGTYDLTVEQSQFATGNFSGVKIAPNVSQETRLILVRRQSQAAGISSPEIEEVVVTGSYVPRGADSERWSENIVDIISAEDFAVTGDSSAVDALARVTGLTVVGDKYVYVRGLGERYSNTTFNRSALPSPDPTRRVIPMDLFPTGALESVDIQKTYAARLPGDFSGGTVQLKTRGVPDESRNKISINIEGNSETTGNSGLIYETGSSGFRTELGFDQGDRSFPTVLNDITQNGTRSLNLATDAELLAASQSLNRDFDTNLEDLPANYGLEFSKGDRFEGETSSLGYSLGVRYDNDWVQRREERATFGLDGQGGLRTLDDSTQFRTEQTVDLSGILNLEYEINDYHSLRSVTFITRQTENRFVREDTFLSENDINVLDSTIEWVERQLFTQQVGGNHLFEEAGNLELDWQATTARANRDEPDTRFYRFEQQPSENYAFSDTGQSNERTWESLEDDVWSVGFDLALPIQFTDNVFTTLEVGYAYHEKERVSGFRRFRFLSDFSQNDLRDELFQADPSDIFADENLGPDLWELVENTLPTDNYVAEEKIAGYYINTDTDLGAKWRLSLGVRLEDSLQDVTTFELINPDQQTVATLDENQILPALTATYSINDDMQLRFGVSRTVNRPDLKELSEAPYIDPEERYTVIGNPNLRLAKIDNYDIRWEWYFNTQDNLQIAAFYKEFDSPIERVIRLGGGGVRSFANADSAENQGVEFSLRKSLGFISEDLWVKFNGAWIDSEIDIGNAGAQQTNQTRELQGQSPWVANFQLGYDNPERDIQATLLFNMAGERITDVGTQGLPDAFEQPVESLDFNYRHAFNIGKQQLRVKLRARNILDPTFEETRGDEVQRSYKKGRTVQLGLDWEF
ncbi:MAG: TonB-dependent receptor [Pseudomonadota bacterium]